MNIQELLKKLNETMSDAEIGEAIGAPQPTVCRLRNGIHRRTYHDRAEAIKSLGVSKGILEADDKLQC